jgi:hypothetical protein
MEVITELTTLQIGNKIHAPKLGKDFIIANYSYNQIFKQMIADLEPTDKNDKSFTITFSDMIELKYQIY